MPIKALKKSNHSSSRMRMNSIRTSTSSQASGSKKLCVFLVHDDPVRREALAEILELCGNYEVLTCGKIEHVLHAIREKKDGLEAVITDINRSDTNGAVIIDFIEKEIKLPVISISSNENTKHVLMCVNVDAKLYFVKSLGASEFIKLWDSALAREKSESGSRRRTNSRDRNQENEDEDENISREDSNPSGKKQRIAWTDTLHQKFLEAIEELGYHRAFPKRIAEIMNVPGVTRANVASHLQKYRRLVKKAEEQRIYPLHGSLQPISILGRPIAHETGTTVSSTGRGGLFENAGVGPSSSTMISTFVGFTLSGDEKSVVVGTVEPELSGEIGLFGSGLVVPASSELRPGLTGACDIGSFGSAQMVPDHPEPSLGSINAYADTGSFDSILSVSNLSSIDERDIESMVLTLLDSVVPEPDHGCTAECNGRSIDTSQTEPSPPETDHDCNEVIGEAHRGSTEGSEDEGLRILAQDPTSCVNYISVSLARDLDSFGAVASSGGGFDATFFDNSN